MLLQGCKLLPSRKGDFLKMEKWIVCGTDRFAALTCTIDQNSVNLFTTRPKAAAGQTASKILLLHTRLREAGRFIFEEPLYLTVNELVATTPTSKSYLAPAFTCITVARTPRRCLYFILSRGKQWGWWAFSKVSAVHEVFEREAGKQGWGEETRQRAF